MMKKIISFFKKNKCYFFFFLFCLVMEYFIIYMDYGFDATWEYGMSHAITKGLLPYTDFNTVTTPFFIFLFSIGLFIKDSFFVFLLEFCIAYTIMFYFLYKLLGNKTIYIFLGMSIFLFRGFIPSYNALSFILIVIIMYFENNKSSDLLIGVLLGLLILTKHTIGIPIFILACIGTFDFNKIKNRLIGASVPIILFIIYLMISNSFYEFFDLCFLGLFDFGSKNIVSFSPTYIIAIILFIISIIGLIKNRKDILFYYALGSIMFIIPICDISHCTYYLSIVLIAFLNKYNFNLKYFPYALFITFLVCNIYIRLNYYKKAVYSNFNHYNYTLTYKDGIKYTNRVLNKVKSYDNYVIISYKGMYFDIISDYDISYFDIPLYGNYGYNGTSKMMDRVKNMHDYYFLIDMNKYKKIKNKEIINEQLDVDLINYIINNSDRVDAVEDLVVYYKK